MEVRLVISTFELGNHRKLMTHSSLVRLFTQLLTFSFTCLYYSLTFTLTHTHSLRANAITESIAHSITHALPQLLTDSRIHSVSLLFPILSFALIGLGYSLTRSLVHLRIHSFAHLLTPWLPQSLAPLIALLLLLTLTFLIARSLPVICSLTNPNGHH